MNVVQPYEAIARHTGRALIGALVNSIGLSKKISSAAEPMRLKHVPFASESTLPTGTTPVTFYIFGALPFLAAPPADGHPA